ncbi:TrkH family potassium uptake protein [Candidatus Eisenbacteria bacterium]|uniref:TrkH family potassium uptake protein n=1 Tax=Eiseniibacteriota bacterium TaxID=2212470 RepID=A0ABV6YI52_UNCEI
MRTKAVFFAIGRLMLLQGGVLLVPMGISLWDERTLHAGQPFSQPDTLAFLVAVLLCLAVGTLLQGICRTGRDEQGIREGFAIVTLGWVTLALLGSIPFIAWFLRQSGSSHPMAWLGAFTNAYFEVMSGFTTTGATILPDIEILPRGLLFWRSLTHWLGGMGIITLALAIFPAMGVAGYQMFRGEVPGPSADRLRPRLAETATILWGVYALLSAAETLLLWLGGMNLFDSLCHTFGTMATGGFSTKNASIGAYNSAYIDWVITIFMLLAGINFLIHYRIIFRRDWSAVVTNRELHFYLGTFVAATLFIAVLLYAGGLPEADFSSANFQNEPRTALEQVEHVAAQESKIDSIGGALRYSTFQVAAILTTTGYGTADFDVWPRAIGFLLVVLMFWGGCAGSTGGGMKMIRILVVLKAAWRELKKVVRPHLISPLKIGRRAVPEDKVANILGFFLLFIGLFVVCSLVMTLFVPDMTTAVTSVAATIGNIGPGLSGIGSTQTYAWIPLPGKWVLILCMLLGRLEIFTVLAVLRPSFWKR